ncbi:hypothetical protein BGW37DRAFT_271127 [Umbelopsis sp. PMI_123]|nr:hypothetical protein BGW37DRAFT_271127 [Umbelopsis sp. PMI_123]
MPYTGRDIALFVIAFFFPPIAVWIRRGFCSTDFLINVCLTCLGAVPGIIHAFYIVHKYNDYFEDIESGGLAYQPVPTHPNESVTYGATNNAE